MSHPTDRLADAIDTAQQQVVIFTSEAGEELRRYEAEGDMHLLEQALDSARKANYAEAEYCRLRWLAGFDDDDQPA